MMIGYGLAGTTQVPEYARAVCDVIGHGSTGAAVPMLVETAAAETLLGQARDLTPYRAGVGLTQIDKGTFDWLKGKYKDSGISQQLADAFGIRLHYVQYDDLRNAPLLAMVFARLRYWTVPEPIPRQIEQRATYWKQHYNTEAGKGTAADYLRRCIDLRIDGHSYQ